MALGAFVQTSISPTCTPNHCLLMLLRQERLRCRHLVGHRSPHSIRIRRPREMYQERSFAWVIQQPTHHRPHRPPSPQQHAPRWRRRAKPVVTHRPLHILQAGLLCFSCLQRSRIASLSAWLPSCFRRAWHLQSAWQSDAVIESTRAGNGSRRSQQQRAQVVARQAFTSNAYLPMQRTRSQVSARAAASLVVMRCQLCVRRRRAIAKRASAVSRHAQRMVRMPIKIKIRAQAVMTASKLGAATRHYQRGERRHV